MSVYPSKRRRVDSQTALLKPFRSPMQSSTPKLSETLMKASDDVLHTSASNVSWNSSANGAAPKNSLAWKLPQVLQPSEDLRSTEIATLQRQHAILIQLLTKNKTELDKVLQALKIETSSRDLELQTLIKQWRSASQLAAEEIYATVRDRINGMGGLQAWRDRERDRKENAYASWSFDETEHGSGGHVEGHSQSTDAAKEYPQEGADDVDDGNFSLELMLRTLNVDLEIIGYDRGNQRWINS